jgi:hypothetical protein
MNRKYKFANYCEVETFCKKCSCTYLLKINKSMGQKTLFSKKSKRGYKWLLLYPRSPKGEGVILFYLCPSVQDIFRRIRSLPSIVAEKNATKNEHICSMCIKINKVSKQEVGIRWVQKRFPRYRVPICNCWWQKSDIWSQASYRYTILWIAFLDPSDSYFLFADLVGLYTHWTCIKTN